MTVFMIRIVALFALLAVAYAAIAWYARWERSKALEDEYHERGETALTREDYVARGLTRYDRSWEKRALLGIFVVPPLLVFLLAMIAT